MKQILSICLTVGLALLVYSCNNNKSETSAKAPKIKSMTVNNATMDPVKVSPANYKLIREKYGIRVLEINYKPGEVSAMHSHPDNVLYLLTDGKAEFTDKSGTKEVVDMKKGTAVIGGPESHGVKNVGNNPIKAYLFEISRPDVPLIRMAEADAEKVAPKEYKVLQDSRNIRVLMADYKPGESSGFHSHPYNAIVTLLPGKLEFTLSGGKKQVADLKVGDVVISDKGSHAAKNIGKTETKVLVVDVNRQ
ncbi:MAG: cupin domain-containing protein [Candidatus Dadabacteria bacterium]